MVSADELERCRTAVLDAIGDPPDLAVVRGRGNRGDDLISAGASIVLRDHIYRTIDLEELPRARGHTVLLPGGGAFCRPFHELMPRALAVAAGRFSRVIVLPSSFDPAVPAVREALRRSTATVFCREAESLRRIEGICDARLAHDLALYFDFSPWASRSGEGTLLAYRTDPETGHRFPLPPGNDDISASAPTLDAWLDRIAAHARIRTDRAHVMLAAARMGRPVEFAASSYFKVGAIARHSLSGASIHELEPDPVPLPRPPAGARRPREETITAVILSRSRPGDALRAVDSLDANELRPAVRVLDNDCTPADARRLRAGCEERPHVVVWRSDRDLGCAGGRRQAIERIDSELILLLDDDAELHPGALDALAAELSAHPAAVGVTATVERPDGRIQHSGGTMAIADGIARFRLTSEELPADGPLEPSGPSGWLPGTATLVRRAAFDAHPLDPGMGAYYEDNEWSLRVASALPAPFRRSAEARATHRTRTGQQPGVDFGSRSRAMPLLLSHAQFLRRHDLLLDAGGLGRLVPELVDADGRLDACGARLLLELLLARGMDWTFAAWCNGGLAPALSSGRRLTVARADAHRARAELTRARSELSAARAALDGERAASHAQGLEIAAQRRAQPGREAQLGHLMQRDAQLVAIESGGWWRLRGRLLPLIGAVRRLTRLASTAAGGRTGDRG